jgi:hypothetical protein
MANDSGKIAEIEAAIVSMIAAATLSGDVVFRTVDHWAWQITGPDSWKAYTPFAFVSYAGTSETAPEGDHDLRQRMEFAVLIGTEISGDPEAARIGKGTDASKRQLGISRLKDIVLGVLQELKPTNVTGVEYLEFTGDTVAMSESNRCALELRFVVDYTAAYN